MLVVQFGESLRILALAGRGGEGCRDERRAVQASQQELVQRCHVVHPSGRGGRFEAAGVGVRACRESRVGEQEQRGSGH
jgi:hypothetical protein